MIWMLFGLAGLVVGVLSGFLGLGGGMAMIPILTVFFGFSQHTAQGTTLAMMIPPIGILAAWTYYRSGYVNIPAAAILCLGFVFGGLIGAKFAVGISGLWLRRIFGVFLLLVSVRMLVQK